MSGLLHSEDSYAVETDGMYMQSTLHMIDLTGAPSCVIHKSHSLIFRKGTAPIVSMFHLRHDASGAIW